MASMYYLISDGFYSEKYPVKPVNDKSRFYACQQVVMETTMLDFYGENLANYLIEIVQKTSPTAIESAFLTKAQKLMVFWVANSINELDTKVVDFNKASSLNSAIQFLETQMRTYIASVPELVAKQAGNTEPNTVGFGGLPTYFYR